MEIGCEEIPARFVGEAAKQLKERVESWLREIGSTTGPVIHMPPRRLALRVEGVAERQRDVREEVRGPAKRIALKEDGSWSPAAEGLPGSRASLWTICILANTKGKSTCSPGR